MCPIGFRRRIFEVRRLTFFELHTCQLKDLARLFTLANTFTVAVVVDIAVAFDGAIGGVMNGVADIAHGLLRLALLLAGLRHPPGSRFTGPLAYLALGAACCVIDGAFNFMFCMYPPPWGHVLWVAKSAHMRVPLFNFLKGVDAGCARVRLFVQRSAESPERRDQSPSRI